MSFLNSVIDEAKDLADTASLKLFILETLNKSEKIKIMIRGKIATLSYDDKASKNGAMLEDIHHEVEANHDKLYNIKNNNEISKHPKADCEKLLAIQEDLYKAFRNLHTQLGSTIEMPENNVETFVEDVKDKAHDVSEKITDYVEDVKEEFNNSKPRP